MDSNRLTHFQHAVTEGFSEIMREYGVSKNTLFTLPTKKTSYEKLPRRKCHNLDM